MRDSLISMKITLIFKTLDSMTSKLWPREKQCCMLLANLEHDVLIEFGEMIPSPQTLHRKGL